MRVICTLPNAAEEINGVPFERTESGMLSGDLPDVESERFLAIPGYAAVESERPQNGARRTRAKSGHLADE